MGIWLVEHGYFVMHSLKAPFNKEVDILAMHPNGHKVHVEVSIPINPVRVLRTDSPADLEGRIKESCDKKFVGSFRKGVLANKCVEEFVKERFHTPEYDRWFVMGIIHHKDPEERVREEFERNGVKLVLFRNVVKDLIELLEEGVYMEPGRRYVQLLQKFLPEEEEDNQAD